MNPRSATLPSMPRMMNDVVPPYASAMPTAVSAPVAPAPQPVATPQSLAVPQSNPPQASAPVPEHEPTVENIPVKQPASGGLLADNTSIFTQATPAASPAKEPESVQPASAPEVPTSSTPQPALAHQTQPQKVKLHWLPIILSLAVAATLGYAAYMSFIKPT